MTPCATATLLASLSTRSRSSRSIPGPARACAARTFPFCTEALCHSSLTAAGLRPAPPRRASTRAGARFTPQERRAAIAACALAPQPLTAPKVRPWTSFLWIKKMKTRTGMLWMIRRRCDLTPERACVQHQGRNHDRQRPGLTAGEDESEQQLVPGEDEHEDHDRHETRIGHGYREAPEHPKMPAAVQVGRLFKSRAVRR